MRNDSGLFSIWNGAYQSMMPGGLIFQQFEKYRMHFTISLLIDAYHFQEK